MSYWRRSGKSIGLTILRLESRMFLKVDFNFNDSSVWLSSFASKLDSKGAKQSSQTVNSVCLNSTRPWFGLRPPAQAVSSLTTLNSFNNTQYRALTARSWLANRRIEPQKVLTASGCRGNNCCGSYDPKQPTCPPRQFYSILTGLPCWQWIFDSFQNPPTRL